MTENEAKEILAKHYGFLRESWKPHLDGKILDAIRVAISSIDKIQQYRVISAACEIEKLGKSNLTGLELAIIMVFLKKLKNYEEIGTEEECREAAEKQNAKPVCVRERGIHEKSMIKEYFCPQCGAPLNVADESNNFKTLKCIFCPVCGQKLDW